MRRRTTSGTRSKLEMSEMKEDSRHGDRQASRAGAGNGRLDAHALRRGTDSTTCISVSCGGGTCGGRGERARARALRICAGRSGQDGEEAELGELHFSCFRRRLLVRVGWVEKAFRDGEDRTTRNDEWQKAGAGARMEAKSKTHLGGGSWVGWGLYSRSSPQFKRASGLERGRIQMRARSRDARDR